ncbi:hypothetical protein BABINDRAFT_163084 [Babjeviella inositovora NRRL Y-12698]|uniref:Uncharacterized protein n=1 Tax=Babjeviella inositovora NRRL Y-12698 TaxID=984486 RepID=A0A1E3QK37_9ASCO|nr:uncharacterized protein BABINDRAFT_163084 [Babjeviella inositovora NRRL Y-12698]ODQ78053.1 hypothetical protein BABINDRAFT_163084 [Babjeviella inositovora NRRL Y-12698]
MAKPMREAHPRTFTRANLLLSSPMHPLVFNDYAATIQRPIRYTKELRVPLVFHQLLSRESAALLSDQHLTCDVKPQGRARVWHISGVDETALCGTIEDLSVRLSRYENCTRYLPKLPRGVYRCMSMDKKWRAKFEAAHECTIVEPRDLKHSFAVVCQDPNGLTGAVKALQQRIKTIEQTSFLLDLPVCPPMNTIARISRESDTIIVSHSPTVLLVHGSESNISAAIALFQTPSLHLIDVPPAVEVLLTSGYLARLQAEYKGLYISLSSMYSCQTVSTQLEQGRSKLVVQEEKKPLQENNTKTVSSVLSLITRIKLLAASAHTVHIEPTYAAALQRRHLDDIERSLGCHIIFAGDIHIFNEIMSVKPAVQAVKRLVRRLGRHSIQVDVPYAYFPALCGHQFHAIHEIEAATSAVLTFQEDMALVDVQTKTGQLGKQLTIFSISEVEAAGALEMLTLRLQALMAHKPRTIRIPTSLVSFFRSPKFTNAFLQLESHLTYSQLVVYGISNDNIAACENAVVGQIAALESNLVQIYIPVYMLQSFTRLFDPVVEKLDGCYGIDPYRGNNEKKISIHGTSADVMQQLHRQAERLRDQIFQETLVFRVPKDGISAFNNEALTRIMAHTGAEIVDGGSGKSGELLLYVSRGQTNEASLVELAMKMLEGRLKGYQGRLLYNAHVMQRRYI